MERGQHHQGIFHPHVSWIGMEIVALASLEQQENLLGKGMRSIAPFPVNISSMESKGRAGGASTHPQFRKKTRNSEFTKTRHNQAGSDSINPQNPVLSSAWIFGV